MRGARRISVILSMLVMNILADVYAERFDVYYDVNDDSGLYSVWVAKRVGEATCLGTLKYGLNSFENLKEYESEPQDINKNKTVLVVIRPSIKGLPQSYLEIESGTLLTLDRFHLLAEPAIVRRIYLGE